MSAVTWITSTQVEPLLHTSLTDDLWVDELIVHAQSLIEAEIGEQDPDDLPAGLVGVAAQITARLWRAGSAAAQNPSGNQQETLGPYNFSAGRFEAGWGLTRGEREQLARFRNPLQTLSTTRGPLETAGPSDWLLDAD